jgi:hypothetical protein
MRRAAIQLLLLMFPLVAAAREASVFTRNGLRLEGLIRLESNAVVIVDTKRGIITRVSVTNLHEIHFVTEENVRVGEGVLSSVATNLPPEWRSDDLGGVRWPGNVTAWSGMFLIRSGGSNLVASSDALHFVSRPVHGDRDLVARISALDRYSSGARAGLMVRESLGAEAVCLSVAAGPGREGTLTVRAQAGSNAVPSVIGDLRPPCWLRLRRDGDLFSAYRSRDGARWSLIQRVELPMPEGASWGLAVASGRADRITTASFDQVREGAFLENRWFTPRVELRSGSVVTASIRSADDTTIHFFGAPPRASVPLAAVTRVVFRWLTSRMETAIRAGRPGVLLANGEFIEGQLRGIERGQVRVGSVLFGLKRYFLEDEVAAVVIRPGTWHSEPYVVKTVDDCRWLGRIAGIGAGEVMVEEAALGLCRIPIYELAELRWPR